MITEKMKRIVFLLKKDIDNSLKKYNLHLTPFNVTSVYSIDLFLGEEKLP